MEQFWEYVKIALVNIKGNKVRSVLTMLGIIIGISSVIMIIFSGNGIKNQISEQLDAIAGGQINLYSYERDSDGNYLEFTQEDFNDLQKNIDGIKGISPNFILPGTAESRKGTFDVRMTLGFEALQYASSDKIVAGRYFTDAETGSGVAIPCVMREDSAIRMFGTSDVIGLYFEVTMSNLGGQIVPMKIVGIRATSAFNGIMSLMVMEGVSPTIQFEAPLDAVLEQAVGIPIGSMTHSDFYVFCEPGVDTTKVAQKCVDFLEARYNVRGQDLIIVDDFNSYLEQFNTIIGAVTAFIVVVASISLLVGGIGVMNIMLVSVTERTREIGIRKSLGARTSSILVQFLAEAGIITLLGGVIGLLLGTLGANLLCVVLGFSVVFQPWVALGACLFSSAIGIFFGIYPAKKAAKLSPIEALRHE